MKDELNKLTKYFLEQNKIDENTEYEIKEIDAKELLVANRIDLVAKLKYIENREKNLNNDFFIRIYKEHLEAFSMGSYVEPGKEDKNSFEKYCEEFDKVIDSIKNDGFNSDISLIPVGEDNTILDGAHRVSAAIYFNKKVKIIKFKGIKLNFDANYFKEKLLDQDIVDYLVLEYAKIKENLYVLCLWPKSFGDKRTEAKKIIEENLKLVYSKVVDLSYTGFRNFMIQVYKEFDWIGNHKNHFNGVYPQLDNCYKDNANLEIVIVESDTLDKVLDVKKQIRDIYNIGNYSIHSTDNKKETLTMLRTVLNRNSINLLNFGNPDKFEKFYDNFLNYKNKIENEKFDIDDFCIDSSGVLALYAIRDTNDIDFLSIADEYKKIEDEKIENHHDYLKYYEKTLSEILYNPTNYFYYDNTKFISLDLVKKMKKNRNEKKDQEDVKMINTFLQMDYKKLKILKLKNTIKRKIRNTKDKILVTIKKVLKKIGLFEIVKKIYRLIRK